MTSPTSTSTLCRRQRRRSILRLSSTFFFLLLAVFLFLLPVVVRAEGEAAPAPATDAAAVAPPAPVVDEAAKKAAEEAAAKKAADEEAAKKKAEEEAAVKKAADEEAAKKKAEEEAAVKKAADEEAAKKKAEEEAAVKKAADEEATKKKAEEEAAVKKAADEEATKKKAEEEAAVKKAADEEAAKKKAEEEEAKKKLEESAVSVVSAESASVMVAELEKALKADKEKLNSEVVGLKKTMAEREAKIKELEEAKTKAEGERDGKSREVEEKKSLLDTSTKELGEARTKITALMIVQEDLMKQKENLHLSYEELRDKYENPEFQHYITKRAEIFYNNNLGLQGAVNKTSELLMPHLEAGSSQYAVMFNNTHTTLKSNLAPILGDHHSHWISGFISYALFFIPLFLSVHSLVSIRAVFKLRGMIMFCHMYFAICTTVAALIAVYLHDDPLRLFHESNAGSYAWSQLILGVVFLAYFALQCLALFRSNTFDLWISRVVQLVAVTVIGGLYYATVFTPAMFDHPPVHMSFYGLLIFYGIPAFIFGIMLVIERSQAEELMMMLANKGREYGQKEEMEILLTSNEDTKVLSKGKRDIISLNDPIYDKEEDDEDQRLTSSASHSGVFSLFSKAVSAAGNMASVTDVESGKDA